MNYDDFYLPDGWINMRKIIEMGYPFNFIWSQRGPGKTFGTLEYCLEEGRKMFFLRRRPAQVGVVCSPDHFMLRPVLQKHPEFGDVSANKVRIPESNLCYYTFNKRDEEGNLSAPIGKAAALSTFASLRGFDGSDVDTIFFDEFVPQADEKPIPEEDGAFFNCYESINRNREFIGAPPVQVICCANSNNIANPIFLSLGLVNQAAKMQDGEQKLYTNDKRGLLMFNAVGNVSFMEKKKKTALYNLVGEKSAFSKMALQNEFADYDHTRISSRPLREFRPLFRVGELSLYEHKSNGRYYATTHNSGQCASYSSSSSDLIAARRAYAWVWARYLCGLIDCEDVVSKVLLEKYFGGRS